MSTQIAVRLPDELVAWLDQQIAETGGSRAALTTRALMRYRRDCEADRDARIYAETGGYPDLGLRASGAVPPLD